MVWHQRRCHDSSLQRNLVPEREVSDREWIAAQGVCKTKNERLSETVIPQNYLLERWGTWHMLQMQLNTEESHIKKVPLTLESLGHCAWTQIPALSPEQPLHLMGTLTGPESLLVKCGMVLMGGLGCLHATSTR